MLVLFIALLCLYQVQVILSKDLDPNTFTSTVLNDNKVWMVEFYSSMCGGCQEFASTWDRITQTFNEKSYDGSILSGKINIDKKDGMKLAEQLGVLEDGVPHVKLFRKKDDHIGDSIVKSMYKCSVNVVLFDCLCCTIFCYSVM